MKLKKFIFDSLEYIDNHLQESITLKQIADSAGYGEYHFSRLFKDDMGVTVMEYVKKRRLSKISEEIINGNKIIDSAMNYGYTNQSSFTKAFKKEYGFSPSILKAMVIFKDSYKDELNSKITYKRKEQLMSNLFFDNVKIHATKEALYDILKEEYINLGYDVNELETIYEYAKEVYSGIYRYSSDEYITHPLNVAIILVYMEVKPSVILASLLCDALDKTSVTRKDIENNVSDKVYEILNKLYSFNADISADEIVNNEDILFIKLAERLHNMKTIGFMEESRKKIKAKETIELFLPLAYKLGNDVFSKELTKLACEVAFS